MTPMQNHSTRSMQGLFMEDIDGVEGCVLGISKGCMRGVHGVGWDHFGTVVRPLWNGAVIIFCLHGIFFGLLSDQLRTVSGSFWEDVRMYHWFSCGFVQHTPKSISCTEYIYIYCMLLC